MEERNMLQEASTRGEINQGLILARQEQYDEAITHCTHARSELPLEPSVIQPKLDAFIAGHDCYCEAEHALHEASERFAAAIIEQRTRLLELQRAFTKISPL
jgi:hypothetical protein